MNKYLYLYQRDHITYVTIEAESSSEARVIFQNMLEDGTIYTLEAEQNNVESEGIISVTPFTTNETEK